MAKRIIEMFEIEELNGQVLVLEDGTLCFEFLGEDEVYWNKEKVRKFIEAIKKTALYS